MALACLTAGAWLHVTSTAFLVSQGPVTNRGEGGHAFDCTYLGTKGYVYVSHFYAAEPDKERTRPQARTHCAWFCTAGLGPRYGGKQLAYCG